jgi:hypothetical protein
MFWQDYENTVKIMYDTREKVVGNPVKSTF